MSGANDPNRYEQYAHLMRQHHDCLYGYVFAMVRDFSDTDDLVQEAKRFATQRLFGQDSHAQTPTATHGTLERSPSYLATAFKVRTSITMGTSSFHKPMKQSFSNPHAHDAIKRNSSKSICHQMYAAQRAVLDDELKATRTAIQAAGGQSLSHGHRTPTEILRDRAAPPYSYMRN